jgi:hypothetical protein
MLYAHIRFHTRHFLVIACLAAVWLVVLVAVGQSSVEVTPIVIIYGEVMLPAVLAVIAAGIVLGDASRELLLIAPYALWKIVVGRLAILLFGAALIWLGFLVLLMLLQFRLQAPPPQVLVGGIATASMFACLGVCVSLWLRSALVGGMVAGAVWAAALLFRDPLMTAPLGVLLHPFLTLQAPQAETWAANRLTLVCLALLFLVLGLQRLHDTEVLLPNEESREGTE